jgi:hypothetical protein
MRARHRHLNQRDAGATLVLDSRRISGLSDGNSVSQWDDASRSGWNVTASGTRLPLYKTSIQGGQPAIRFDGTDDRLISSSVSTTQPFSSLCVIQLSDADTDAALVWDSYNNTQCVFGSYSTGGAQFPGPFSLFMGTSDRKFQSRNNNWNVFALEATNTSCYIAMNGDRSNGAGSAGSNGLDGISIGDLRGNPNAIVGGYRWRGDMSLICLFGKGLLNPLRKRLEHAAAYSFKISCN